MDKRRAFKTVQPQSREDAEQFEQEADAQVGWPWPSDGQDPEAAEAAQRRLEKQRHIVLAVELFKSPSWHDELVALVQSLKPQLRLMSRILSQRSDAVEIKEQMAWEEKGARKFPAVTLMLGVSLHEAMQDELVTFKTFLWPTCPDTEMNRSWIFRLTMRAAAVIYQLLRVRLSMFPYRLLALLDNRTVKTAQEILSVPPCLRDHLAKYLLNQFRTPEELVSLAEAWQILHGIASLQQCTTYGVECLHSGNTRRSKSVTHTHRRHVSQIALHHHVPWAGPTWMTSPKIKESGKKKGRPPKRKNMESAMGDEDEEPRAHRRRGGGGP